MSCELAHPWVLVCIGSPLSGSVGPKLTEVHRTRHDHGVDPAIWTFGFNLVQCDVARLTKHMDDVLFRESYENIARLAFGIL